MIHMIQRVFFVLFLCVLLAASATIASAQDVVLSADSQSFMTNVLTHQNNLVVTITLLLAGFFLTHHVLQLIQAHRNAKTEQERDQARQHFLDQLATMFKDEHNRNAAERALMATEMLPVRRFLDIVGEVAAILHTATGIDAVGELSDYLEDVTKTDEGEDLSIEYRTDDNSGSNHRPPDDIAPPELVPVG